MKKAKDIVGLPIISISDGIEVGRVKTVIINAEKGAVDYVVVDSGIQVLSAKVIPTENVLGIGEYAEESKMENFAKFFDSFTEEKLSKPKGEQPIQTKESKKRKELNS